MAATQSGDRKSKNDVSVFITEGHNDVVPFIHRAIASKRLPFQNTPIVHLDSHPDLLIPQKLQADMVFKPKELYEAVSIENWLLPQVFAKHVNPVVWIKPPWAHQIAASSQRFCIGKCKQSGLLRLSSRENYFLTDGLYRHPKGLTESYEVHLLVLELRPHDWELLDTSFSAIKDSGDPESTKFSDYQKWTSLLFEEINGKPFILDIDLDFFSTQNPFKDMLSPAAEKAVRRLYYSPGLSQLTEEDLERAMLQREKHLNFLEQLWTAADSKRSVTQGNAFNDQVLSKEIALSQSLGMEEAALTELTQSQEEDIRLILSEVWQGAGETTFIQVHDFGCTLDDTELPHHVSTVQQVDALFVAFSDMMDALPPPALVTIARSSLDEYCPPSCVDQYENEVLQILTKHYGSLNITKDYS